MPVKLKYALLFLSWLAGTILLWTSGNKTPAIIISGAILLRAIILEIRKKSPTRNFPVDRRY